MPELAEYLLARADAGRLPLADRSVQCCVTSPPYFGLRDYGQPGQIGLEPTPDAYVARLVYERTITSLSTSTTINWLLTSHPDIYLYATLCEAAPYLKDDNRLQMWQMLLAERLEELHSQRQFSDLSSQAQPNTGVTFGG